MLDHGKESGFDPDNQDHVCLFVCFLVFLLVAFFLFVTNHGEEPACNPDNEAHVDAASALENSRWGHKDPAADDAPNDHLDNDDHDDDDDGDSVADDDGGDNYSASIEKSHFCFETDSLPLPRLNFKLLISVTEKGVTYKTHMCRV